MKYLKHLAGLWLVFTISYADLQRAINSLTGEVVVYTSRGAGAGYNLFLLHERLTGHVAQATATGADATDFDLWKSTCTQATKVQE